MLRYMLLHCTNLIFIVHTISIALILRYIYTHYSFVLYIHRCLIIILQLLEL